MFIKIEIWYEIALHNKEINKKYFKTRQEEWRTYIYFSFLFQCDVLLFFSSILMCLNAWHYNVILRRCYRSIYISLKNYICSFVFRIYIVSIYSSRVENVVLFYLYTLSPLSGNLTNIVQVLDLKKFDETWTG